MRIEIIRTCCGKASLDATGCDIKSLSATEIIDETNEYQILVAEALYKNYYQQTNDSAVVAAAAYYDSIFDIYPENKDLAFQTARAHWHLLPTNQPAEESFPYKKNLELTAI